jgi:hypothetical protein
VLFEASLANKSGSLGVWNDLLGAILSVFPLNIWCSGTPLGVAVLQLVQMGIA